MPGNISARKLDCHGTTALVLRNPFLRLTNIVGRPDLGQGSHGTVFSPLKSPVYNNKTPYELMQILLAESAQKGRRAAATLYFDYFPAPLAKIMTEAGITVVNLSKITPPEMTTLLEEAKMNRLSLDYHAPWLSKKGEDGACYYPTPATELVMFTALTVLAEKHYEVFGKKPEITIHVSGRPGEWEKWITKTKPFAQILVENAFREPGIRVGIDAYNFFLKSDFHSPEETINFAKSVGINEVCYDQAHGFGGYRPDGRFDALGDLKYLEKLLEAGLKLVRFHRTSVPRQLAGQEKGTLNVENIDQHGWVTPFTRQWFLTNYPLEKAALNRIFDKINKQNALADNGIKFTLETKPHLWVGRPEDLATGFSS